MPVKGTVTAALEGDPPHAGRIRRSSRRRGFGPELESRAMPSLGTALLSSPTEPVSESERLGFAGPALRASEPRTTRILGPKGCVCGRESKRETQREREREKKREPERA